MFSKLKAFKSSSLIPKKSAADTDPVVAATKQFIKSTDDAGIASLPTIIEACSSAAHDSLGAQVVVLDLITKYLSQQTFLSRQLRAIDLLRFLSDQGDNEMFHLMQQDHPIIKALSTILSGRGSPALLKNTSNLLDHFCRQPNVPGVIVELHAKHVAGHSRGHPTIILSNQEAVADDIEAAEGQASLLAELLEQQQPDMTLIDDVHTRMINTRTRLARSADTSTSDEQTLNIVGAIENLDVALKRYDTTKLFQDGVARAQSPSNIEVAQTNDYAASRTSFSSNSNKGKEKITRSDTEDELDNYGEGSSNSRNASVSSFIRDTQSVPDTESVPRNLSSNNPFNKAGANPFSDAAAMPSELTLNEQFRTLKM